MTKSATQFVESGIKLNKEKKVKKDRRPLIISITSVTLFSLTLGICPLETHG